MNNAPTELELAEARVAASTASVVAQGQVLKLKMRRLVTSPLVIGGLVTAAAAVGYFAVMRSARPRARSSRPAAYGNLMSVLKTAQMLLPLLGAVGAATAALERSQGAFPVDIPLPEGAAQKEAAVEPWALPPQGNWLSQQWQMIQAAVKAWMDDYAPSMGAALSYSTLFSLAPLLIIVIAVAGMVFGQQAAQGEIVAQLRGIMGAEGAGAVVGTLVAAPDPAPGVAATVGGFPMVLLGATAIFGE